MHRSRFDELVSGMVRRVEHLEKEGLIGDPGREGVLMGPLIQESQAEKVWNRIESAIKGGGQSHDSPPAGRDPCPPDHTCEHK